MAGSYGTESAYDGVASKTFDVAGLAERLEQRLRARASSAARSSSAPVPGPSAAAGALLLPEVRRDVQRAAGAYLVKAFFTGLNPVSIWLLLRWFEETDTGHEDELGSYARGLSFLCLNAVAVTGQHLCQKLYASWSSRAGLRCQTAMAGVLYRRTLGLSAAELGGHSSGELAALLSVDADHLSEFWTGAVALVIQPFELLGLICLLWLVVAEATLGALALAAVSFATSHVGGRAVDRHNSARSALCDQRLQNLSEVLHGIKVVKANGWVHRFEQRIRAVAKKESRHALRKKLYMGEVLLFSNEMIDVMAMTVALLSILVCGQEPSASRFFTMWVFMGVLHGKIFSFPETLRMVLTAWVSLRRLAGFLSATSATGSRGVAPAQGLGHAALSIKAATFSYVVPQAEGSGGHGGRQLVPVLREVNLDLQAGGLYAVIGSVGSGKTSLLLGILGEMSSSEGSRVSWGSRGSSLRLAYVPQDPVIYNDTVRENICFGRPFDAQRFADVCRACALEHDLKLWAQGDCTVIGSRGINISGGQQSRLCFARALYADADAYLLDDPLAKLDVRVSAEVFASAITGVLGGKTRLLVTNAAHVVQQCDAVVSVADGTATLKACDLEELKPILGAGAGDPIDAGDDALPPGLRTAESEEAPASAILASLGAEATGGAKERTHCTVGIAFFLNHLAAGVGSRAGLALYVLSLVAMVCMVELGIHVLVLWGEDPHESRHTHLYYAMTYLAFIAAEVLMAQLRYPTAARATQAAWDKLHDDILVRVLRSSLVWLQAVPVGQVLHLFSRTMGILEDEVFASTDLMLLQFMFLPAVATVVCVGFPPFVLVVALVALAMYCVFSKLLSKTSDSRPRSVALRSQCLEHYTETVGGLCPVRVFSGAAASFTRRFDDMLAQRAEAQAACLEADEGGLMQLSLVGAVLYVLAVSGTIAARAIWGLSPGFAGLMIANACFFSILLTVSIERGLILLAVGREREVVQRLIRSIPQEMTAERGFESERLAALASGPSASWPSRGEISIEGLQVRYRPDLPPAIHSLWLSVSGGDHVGVVGRSGSGKSSLLLALARLVEPSSGRILIDGIDIAGLGLMELRPHLGVLSQDPLFFSGRLRENLDPFQEHPDEKLWSALDDVGLAPLFASAGLETAIAELGGNLSVGERQLLCLARAALRAPRIVLVDEATAALDEAADARVQEVLDRRFRAVLAATVLQVAHRLWSVVGCQAVAVLRDGALAEFGPPSQLLAPAPEGGKLFAEMVAALGEKEAQAFRVAAAGLAPKLVVETSEAPGLRSGGAEAEGGGPPGAGVTARSGCASLPVALPLKASL